MANTRKRKQTGASTLSTGEVMNDQGAVLSALVLRATELLLVLLLVRMAAAFVLAAAARAFAHRPAGSPLAAAAVRLAPRFARSTVLTVVGASMAVALP